MSWLRPPKQPTNSCFIKCLFLHTFLVGNKILLASGMAADFSDCTLSAGLLFDEFPVLFACVHDFGFSDRLYDMGSGIALKWKKYSSGQRQFRSNCWTLSAWSMWWRYVFLWWNGWMRAWPNDVWCTRNVLSSFTSGVAGEPKNCKRQNTWTIIYLHKVMTTELYWWLQFYIIECLRFVNIKQCRSQVWSRKRNSCKSRRTFTFTLKRLLN